MKRCPVFAFLLLMLLPALVVAQQTNQQSTVPSHSSTASVAGTTWAGTDSDGDHYEYHFQADGTLHYNSPTGSYENGTWEQHGDSIYMETNKKFSEREGRISGTHMKGKAWNVKGQKWTWAADMR
jgi:outer membrane biogenesis lipoprotein LolB